MAGKYSFWKLINEYEIKIPVIQRDYAQGRLSAKAISNNFLNSIENHLVNNKGLDMNFVYGSISEQEFIPIDGQQRLTTLFLLHCYLIHATGKNIDDYSVIRSFSYKTRISSSNFCMCLTKKVIQHPNNELFKDIENLKETIVDNAWFASSWRNDPTVDAMLNMLNLIHERFGKRDDLNILLDRLTSDDCPLFFYFLDLGKYDLEDSIYIKMNARGKALTDYENFKAKLEKYMRDKGIQKWDDYSKRLDREWTETFWEYTGDSAFGEDGMVIFDDKMLNFIANYIYNEYACYTKSEGREALRAEFNRLFSLSRVEFTNEFVSFNNGLCDHLIEESLEDMFEVFRLMTNGKRIKKYAPRNPYFDEEEIFKDIITAQKQGNGFSDQTRVKFYAYTRFLLNNKEKIRSGAVGGKELTEWFRIIKHIINGEYFTGEDKYVRVIQGINWIARESSDVLTFLNGTISNDNNDSDAEEMHGLNKYIFAEECVKAALMIRFPEWDKAIRLAEANPYLNGEINIVLEFAGVNDEIVPIRDWSNEMSQKYLEEFKKYNTYFDKIFIDGGTYVGLDSGIENEFRRALLTKGDFTQTNGQNSSMLVNKSNPSGAVTWAQLFKPQKNKEFATKRAYLKNLLDDAKFDINDIKGSCEAIVKDYKCDDNEYKYFIQIPELMDFVIGKTEEKKLSSCWNFFRNSDQTRFLLWTSRLSGYNYDYYKYALYLVLKRENSEKLLPIQVKCGIADVKSEPLYLKNGDETYKIDFNYETRNYEISGGTRNINESKDSLDGMVAFIKDNNLI